MALGRRETDDLHVRIALQRDPLSGLEVRRDIDRAALQEREPVCRRGHRLLDHVLDGRLVTPEVRVGLEHDLNALLVLGDVVRAESDAVRVRPLRRPRIALDLGEELLA